MIITDQTRQGRRRAARITAAVLGIITLFAVGFALRPDPTSYHQLPEGAVYCGAEHTRGGQLVNEGHTFGKSSLRSDTQARSGRYACFLPASGQTEYGFNYQLDNPAPGTAYLASVWRLKNAYNAGVLAVQTEGEAPTYQQENIAIDSDDKGWEKLEIRFFIPYGKKTDKLNIYVYGGGAAEVYFDDFLIEQLSAGGESFQPEVLNLRIKKEAMEVLRRKREQALQAGILESGSNDWVEAELEGDSSGPMKVDIRLKGDWLDHLRGDKWSFRVKMKEAYAWRRMRSFSLHTPVARYYLHEWLLHQLWEQEDVLTTRYDFIELRLNGESLGIYAYEEHFDKQAVEFRQRREGPILKFSEDGHWKAIRRQLTQQGFLSPAAEHAALDWENAPVEAFQETDYQPGTPLYDAYQEGIALMEQFRSGQVRPEEAFDILRMARYYAICDVLHAYHGIAWHNQRFYYNPVTGKLEPFGFDGFGEKPEGQYTILGHGALNPQSFASESFFAALFMDPGFTQAYIRELYRLSSREYLSPRLDSLSPGWGARLAFLQMEFPEYQARLEDFLAQSLYVHSLILPFGQYSLQAYGDPARGAERRLRLENRHNLPLAVVGYGLGKQSMGHPLDSALILPAQMPREYWLRLQRDHLMRNFGQSRFLYEKALLAQAPPLFQELEVSANAEYVFYRVLGNDSLFSSPVVKRAPPPPLTDAQALRRRAGLKPGGPYRIEGRNVVFPAGEYRLAEDLVIPNGYLVVLQPGAVLDLSSGAHFISFSPVQAYGTEEQPVKIVSNSSKANGFTVMQTEEPSVMQYVVFEGLNRLKEGNWELTGAVTFYEADAQLYRCVFRKNQSEDGLNIIRSEFELSHCLFTDTPSDAFDSDFSKGTVDNCRFTRTGNDGMDFSGSVVHITDCYLEENGDKGVSVGEESDVTFFNSSIRKANIAVASKDLSLLFIRGLDMEDCQQGFVAFQKKPEFGGGKIIVESYTAKNIKRLHAISEGSMLQLGEEEVEEGRGIR
ncbi:MAG: CotH kinase family protein [Lewinellaceae bacterium]|nr:CotH kinase family protein [Phaeodactylibacter sp.]MCB9351727.1 CotH kinase family protein [Lewinellaceae bacterium]